MSKVESETMSETPQPIEARLEAILSPIDPLPPAATKSNGFAPLIIVVGFHHARGPEVENWFGVEDDFNPATEYGWDLLPFMALSDGAHALEEDFSYFTLLKPETDTSPATSLFGISCTRQISSNQLLNRPPEVTRSTVQKAVVVIADTPQFFSMLRERLSIVTQAWFAQREFTDIEILRRFQESLADEKARGVLKEEADRGHYIGLSLRELIHEFKWQTLVLLKCCLLQPKMLFFGSRCDKLCMVQFALISLIPGLIRHLQDCADPDLDSYERNLSVPTSLQSSNRSSLLSFMGLPLQLFGKGSLFGPYTPLQQLDVLADVGTKSYMVGSTNSLLLQQKDRYSDILINLDESTVNITSPSLRAALVLTPADRRWMDFLTQEVYETWDPANPIRPRNMQYAGSEEFIRSQFEGYILGLISSVKYHGHMFPNGNDQKSTQNGEIDPAVDYGLDWVEAWMRTENYRMWNAHTDSNLFAVSEPKHPMAGGLTIEDVQRRIAEQVKDLHLDERFAQGREMLGRNIAVGKEKASSMFNKLYSDVEYLRESQKRRAEDARGAKSVKESNDSSFSEKRSSSPAPNSNDLARSQTVGNRASAYMSSWASWAGDRKKTSGWGASWGRKKSEQQHNNNNNNSSRRISPSSTAPQSPVDRDHQFARPPIPHNATTTTSLAVVDVAAEQSNNSGGSERSGKAGSFSESNLSSNKSESSERPATEPSDVETEQQIAGAGGGGDLEKDKGVVEMENGVEKAS